jgi:peptidoglycan LD-endopeptidase CwlK
VILGRAGVVLLLMLSVAVRADTRIQCLLDAYSGALTLAPNGRDLVVHRTGQSFSFFLPRPMDPFNQADFEELLERNRYLEGMFLIPYPRGEFSIPRRFEDPGRFRVESFFKALYGDSAVAVRKNLVRVEWPFTGEKLLFQRQYGASEALKRVIRDLEDLVVRNPSYRAFLVGDPDSVIGGTFHWRTIAGTERLSTHAYGIGIDLNVRLSDYWKWNQPNAKGLYPYKNRYPFEIVDIFERHGFVWGGRWYHYDSMHFEYRPEILCAQGSR